MESKASSCSERYVIICDCIQAQIGACLECWSTPVATPELALLALPGDPRLGVVIQAIQRPRANDEMIKKLICIS